MVDIRPEFFEIIRAEPSTAVSPEKPANAILEDSADGILPGKRENVNGQFSLSPVGECLIFQFSLQFLLLRKKREYRKISVSDMILRDKKEAMALLQRTGNQFPGTLIPRDGFINSIRDPKSPVKKELKKLCKVKILGGNLTKRVARDGNCCRFAEGKS